MKIKDYLIEHSETSSEARRRRLLAQAIVEYQMEGMTLREALGTIEELLYKQVDIMPTDVLQSEYDKIFNR